MENDQKVSINSRGIGFCGILFIVLLLLKVGVVETAVTGWSWWLITLPLWGPTCLVFGIIAINMLVILSVGLIIFSGGLIVMAISDQIEKIKTNKTTKK